ncbi:MAG TPA: hypothetical protein C5S51_03995 [Methanosarcinaceae archaeon]|nr:hypothetical protein [Methanosarcinaceae archaeon]
MAKSNRILLVEGETDRSFFEGVCTNLGLHTNVRVALPKDIGGSHNTREGVFNILPIWLNQLADATVTRLAVIVDADSVVNGGGCQRAIDRITKIVEQYDFTLMANHSVAGVLFENDYGLADFGLWVMPNNDGEGMLEDWIKSCVHSNEHELFTHAEEVVGELSPQKFKPIHRSKAEVATWLAWQKTPGHWHHVVEEQLIDTNSELFKELSDWLNHIYGSEGE